MKFKVFAVLFVVFAFASLAVAGGRNWQSGTLTDTEQSQVQEGSTKNTNTDATAKDKGNKTDYSQNTTSTTTANYETYQTYTIEAGNKIFIGREHLLFPWSKPANVNVGDTVKYAIDRGKLYIQDSDGKEHKATLVKTSLKSTP